MEWLGSVSLLPLVGLFSWLLAAVETTVSVYSRFFTRPVPAAAPGYNNIAENPASFSRVCGLCRTNCFRFSFDSCFVALAGF